MGGVQEVEYVKAEDKLERLEACLQKTAPPVMVFAEKTRDVDMVHEALLLRNINASAIHGAAASFPLRPLPFVRPACSGTASDHTIPVRGGRRTRACAAQPRRSRQHSVRRRGCSCRPPPLQQGRPDTANDTAEGALLRRCAAVANVPTATSREQAGC